MSAHTDNDEMGLGESPFISKPDESYTLPTREV